MGSQRVGYNWATKLSLSFHLKEFNVFKSESYSFKIQVKHLSKSYYSVLFIFSTLHTHTHTHKQLVEFQSLPHAITNFISFMGSAGQTSNTRPWLQCVKCIHSRYWEPSLFSQQSHLSGLWQKTTGPLNSKRTSEVTTLNFIPLKMAVFSHGQMCLQICGSTETLLVMFQIFQKLHLTKFALNMTQETNLVPDPALVDCSQYPGT